MSLFLVLLFMTMSLSLGESSSAGDLFELGNEQYSLGNLAAAKDLYLSAIGAEDKADFRCNLASVLVDLAEPAQAMESYEAALEMDGFHPDALFNYGMLLQDEKRTEEAISMYLRLSSIEPDNCANWSNLGAALHQVGKVPQAVKAYHKAIGLAPGQLDKVSVASLYENLGRAQLRLYDNLISISQSEQTTVSGSGKANPKASESEDDLETKTSKLRAMFLQSLQSAVRLNPENEVARHLLHANRLPHEHDEEIGETVGGGVIETEVGIDGVGGGGDTAPAAYVRQLFDDYASNFENSLSNLAYRAPQLLVDALLLTRAGAVGAANIESARDRGDSEGAWGAVLDLGCGTGLVGPLLTKSGSGSGPGGTVCVLAGIDLSGGMLLGAESKGIYDYLVKGDIAVFLRLLKRFSDRYLALDSVDTRNEENEENEEHKENEKIEEWSRPQRRKTAGSIIKDLDVYEQGLDMSFDRISSALQGEHPSLAVAADVFVYIGNLTEVIDATLNILSVGDYFAFTVESSDSDSGSKLEVTDIKDAVSTRDWELKSSGRYAHSRRYLEKLFSYNTGWELDTLLQIVPRVELGKDINGYLVIARKRKEGTI